MDRIVPSRVAVAVAAATIAVATVVLGPRPVFADDAPVSDGRLAVLAQINAYRAAEGVAPARLNAALTRSAESHVAYYDANAGDPSLAGMGLHRETPGAPGFLGVTMGDRARAAGFRGGSVTENAGFGPFEAQVDWFMASVNHRLPLLHPSATEIGLAISDVSGFGIVDVGLTTSAPPSTLPAVYPPDGSTDVPASWDGMETPDPAPGVARPLGPPLTVAFGARQRVVWQDLELFTTDGTPIPIATPRTDWMRAAAIIPLIPLDASQTYTAHVAAQVDGKPVTRDWSFTTAN